MFAAKLEKCDQQDIDKVEGTAHEEFCSVLSGHSRFKFKLSACLGLPECKNCIKLPHFEKLKIGTLSNYIFNQNYSPL